MQSPTLTHEELHAETVSAARREKTATLDLLRFLRQIEVRRTYAVLGYPSLFKYVEDGLNYSPAQTSDRVSAMRLLHQVPIIAEKMTNGAHTLTSIAKLAAHVRRENLDQAKASALVHETAHQTIVNLEKHLAGVAEMELPKLERAKVISKERTRLTLDVDDEFMAAVARMRERKGNPGLGLTDLFLCAMKEFIKNREPKPPKSRGKIKPKTSDTSVAEVELKTQMAADFRPRRSRTIRRADQFIARTRAKDQCEYRHGEFGRRCESKTGLQFEHLIPFAKGGSNGQENLKLYCPAHNRLSAIQAFGEAKMRPFLKS